MCLGRAGFSGSAQMVEAPARVRNLVDTKRESAAIGQVRALMVPKWLP